MAELASCMINSTFSISNSNSNSNSNSQSHNSNVDLSWLPNYNDNNNFTPHSDNSNDQNGDENFDYSWLPNYNDINTNTNTNTNTGLTTITTASSRSNNSYPENDLDDYSWLPVTPTVKHVNINTLQNSWLPKNNNNNTKNNTYKTTSKSSHSSHSQKAEPSTHIVSNNEDKTKETSSNKINNKSRNNDQAREVAPFGGDHHLNKKPESSISQQKVSCNSECLVESDSLGGVSTLLRRWKDITETKNSNRKSKHSSHTKSNDAFVIGKSRLIRGCHAFKDFLNIIQEDKRRELQSLAQRNPVSNFSHRGRIKAVLHVISMRYGVGPETEAKSHNPSVSKTIKMNSSDIKDPRDRFSTGVKHNADASRKINNNGETKKSHANPVCPVGCSPVREVEGTTTTNTQEPQSIATSATATTTTTLSQEPQSIDTCKQEAKDLNNSSHSIQSKEDTHDYLEKKEKVFSSGIDEKGLAQLENHHHWICGYFGSQSDWDEEEEEEEEFYYNHDWIRDIARPKSDWESMRQARYKEMLHLYSYNPDIQELLQRKSVSGFLSSHQRDKLDQLMVSRAQRFELMK